MDITTLVTSVVSFIFTTAGKKLISNATDATLQKINTLRKKVVDKLRSKPSVKEELEKKKDINVEKIKSYLQVEMIEDDKFKQEIEALIEEIKKDLESDGQNVMNIFGGKGYQQNQNQGEIYNADTINFNQK